MKKIYTLALAALLLCSCGGDDKKGESVEPGRPASQMTRGEGSLVYTGYAPLADKPVTLYYYIPEEGNISSMKILFAMQGADRNAPYQITTWKQIAEDKKVIVLAPHFDKTYYPEIGYQYGGVSRLKSSYDAVAKEKWTYNIIESLFDFVKQQTGNTSTQYDIWGHSAGGQFVHRFMFYMPDTRVRTAIASNAGFYTVPLTEGYTGDDGVRYGWPYSLYHTPYTNTDVKKYLSRNLIVHLGTKDLATTKEQDSHLPVDAGSVAQGASRYVRGQFFFEQAKAQAESLGVNFGWRKAEVNGISHNSRGMVQTGPNAAAVLLYD